MEGREFAFDAYYDKQGNPVVLGIFEHLFSGTDDVSDRVYITSKSLMKEFLPKFTEFLQLLNHQLGLKNFPLHAEVRITENGALIPIEVNPLRFGGWCTTADVTPTAYGINPYLSFFNQCKPDWDTILSAMGDSIYSLIVLDKPKDLDANASVTLDWPKLLATLSHPLSHRIVSEPGHPLFGFIFAETAPDKRDELNQILNADLTQYIQPTLALVEVLKIRCRMPVVSI